MLEFQKDIEKQLRSATSEGFCSWLNLMTDSYGHCVTSKADSSKERNPILQDYCSISEGERKLQF